jgi:hypothetical protein
MLGSTVAEEMGATIVKKNSSETEISPTNNDTDVKAVTSSLMPRR